MKRGIVALIRCKITGGQLATNDEVTAFRWASGTRDCRSADRGLRHPRSRPPCVTTSVSQPVRAHDGVRLLSYPVSQT